VKKAGVILHGNLTHDTIFVVDEPIRLGVNNKAAKVIRREGGIMNLARALKGTILNSGF
jgi:hypothetical protein